MSWGPRRGVSAMRRSSRRRRGRRSDSRSTARAIERTPSTNLIAVPDGARPLSEGLLVEASVVARLLRIRLLAIDASLIVAPAHVQGQTRTAAHRRDEMLAPATAPRRSHAIGAGLAAAERILDEGCGRAHGLARDKAATS
jgi:hypothetical protein